MTSTTEAPANEVLAEFEVWHSRPVTPTRRLALGALALPVDPPPGLGGLLLGAVVAAHAADLDPDVVPDVHRLIHQVERGERIVQPRLRHRFQVDRHGLARSVHRMRADGESVSFEFAEGGTALQQVLGAIYALERIELSARRRIAVGLVRALTWRGPLDRGFLSYLVGDVSSSIAAMADPRAWALDVLGFPAGTTKPTKREIQSRYREGLRNVHPDHGGDQRDASRLIDELSKARRLLLDS